MQERYPNQKALEANQLKPGYDPKRNSGKRLKASEKIVYWLDEFASEDEEGNAIYSLAQIEEDYLDAPAGDTKASIARRIAAKMLHDACSKGSNLSLKTVSLLLDRQLGRPTVAIEQTHTFHQKEVCWDSDPKADWQDPGLLLSASVELTEDGLPIIEKPQEVSNCALTPEELVRQITMNDS